MSSSEEDPTPTAAVGREGGGSDDVLPATVGGGGGGDAPAGDAASDRKSRGGGGEDEDDDADDDDDDDEAALERMMAFQEEQLAADAGVPAPGGRGHAGDGALLGGADPHVAFLGDGDDEDEYDDEDEDDDGGAAPRALFRHPNLNNPAAVALRRRQAAAMRDGLAGGGRRRADGAGVGAARLLRALPRLRYVPASMAAALLLLHRTMRTRRQFYLAVTYLQTSKLSYVVLGNAVIAFGVGLFGAVTSVFLDGGLRPNERDTIGENIRWDVTETCLALTIFRSELDVFTALEFLVLVVMKCLHWSVELRGGHLRMTEEVFEYPEEDHDDDHVGVVDRAKGRSWFHWWGQNRMPRLRLTHVSYYSLVLVLLSLDVLAVAHCALSVATHGASVDILFGFEAAILLVSGLSSLGMYHLHVIDGVMGVFHHLAEGEHHRVPLGGLADDDAADEGGGRGPTTTPSSDDGGGGERRPQDPAAAAPAADRCVPCPPATTRTRTLARKLVERLANPWRDHRAMLSFAIELQAQAVKFLFYLVFFAIVFTFYGMPINIFREVYVSFQQLRRRLIAFNTYRRLTHNMGKRFESIKDEEELDRLGHTCIICRDSMDLLGGCKKLPGCGHAFHTHCLRDWLVQQQTCPTCRSDIAANEARDKKRLERAAAAAAAAAMVEELANVPVVEGGVEQDAAPAVAPVPAPGDDANAVAAANDAASPLITQESNRASQLDQRSTPTLTGDDTLPPGWTQHIDEGSGRAYYFNRGLGKTTWEKPGGAKTALAETATAQQKNDASSDGIAHVNDFPCLYRITHSTGAKVYDRRSVQKRLVPQGKLIVCTSIEQWPNEAMLRMPDGYVRCRDVSFEFSLFTPPEGAGKRKVPPGDVK